MILKKRFTRKDTLKQNFYEKNVLKRKIINEPNLGKKRKM